MKKLFKLSSLLMCVVVLLSSMCLGVFAEGEAVLGDVDGSGKVDTQDARAILKMACGIDEVNIAVADMNGDGFVTVTDAIQALKTASSVAGVEIPDKNGDNYLSDDPNNEFIKLVSQEYGVDSKALVAIYSVPDSGTNYVLQFKKNVLTYDKSPDGLVKVYHIGAAPEREISYTDGKSVGGDHYNCSAAEGVIVFSLVQSKVMPQYPTYFNGV